LTARLLGRVNALSAEDVRVLEEARRRSGVVMDRPDTVRGAVPGGNE
jgi:hypothetical protein